MPTTAAVTNMYAQDMQFRVLGSVQAIRDDIALPIGGPKQRLVLALLLIDVPNMVSTSRLIEGLWADDPPETARKTLQGYVHHLRAALGESLVTDSVGYRLEVDPASIDAAVFESLVRDARQAAPTSPQAAADQLTAALGMWRGAAYADLDGALALEPEIGRLNEMRIGALEDRLAADLQLGVDGSLVGELESLVHDYPLRERFRALHMRALYLNGRQAEALRAYDRARAFLGQELGLEPSRELKELEKRIVADDLESPPGVRSEPRPSRGIRGYELREKVGTGALGTVNRAFQTSVGRQVALKTLGVELADNPRFIERFEDESRRVGSLRHEHIVPLLDAWREPGAAYQVRPWMDGGNLYMQMGGEPLPQPKALQVLDEIGAALDHAHRIGFAHCRVKPSNILFDADGRAFVTDFALAEAEGLAHGDDDLEYLAPEMLNGHGSAGPATDVYSLGVLAHQMLSGELPQTVEAGTRPSPELPNEYHDVLTQACLDEPTLRFSRVEDLIRALKQVAGVDVTAAGASVRRSERSEIRNPYKGLRAFQESDAGDFFGRDDLVQRLVATLEERDFVAVVGPSGIGKSSAVKAGLIPELRKRNSAASPILVTEMFPGTHPFEELATALLKVAVGRPAGIVGELMSDQRGLLRVAKEVLPAEGRLVLVIDQFEELFTLVADEGRRRLFLDSLRATVRDERARIQVVATMRADFYDRPLEYRDFGELVEAGAVTVLAPSEEDLRQTIAAPARHVGLDLEPGLVAEIVRDVMDQPGGLPLMQYALTDLVERRTSDVLTVDGYHETGGVLGALGTRAEELWQTLSTSGREAIRQTFLRLVTVAESSDDMRRRVRRSELAALGIAQKELTEAVTLFGAHRLLTFDRDPITRGPTVEVAHEALLREWGRLRGWIESQKEDLVLHRLLATELGEWEAAEKESSYLLRGGRLAQFELWEQTTDISLTTAEREFLESSRSLREAEEAKERRTQRRLRSMLVGVSVLALVALIAGVFAAMQADQASANASATELARDEAETRRLALQAPQLADTNRQVALLLAVEAYDRNPSDPAALGALQDVFVSTDDFLGYIVPPSRSGGVGFTAAGDVVVLSGTELAVYEQVSGRRSRQVDVGGSSRFASATTTNRAAVADGSLVVVYDVLQQAELHKIDTRRASPITSLEFDRSGDHLAVGFEDGAAFVWELITGRTMTIEEAHPERGYEGIEVPPHLPDEALFGTRALAFSDDGTLLATGGLVHLRVWDLTRPGSDAVYDVIHDRQLIGGSRIPEAVRAVRFAPASNDRLFVASSINYTEHSLFDEIVVGEANFPNRIEAIVNAAEQETVALTEGAAILAEFGGRVTVLHLDGRNTQFDTHHSGEPSIGVAADGRTVAVANDGGVSVWSLEGRRLLATSVPALQANEASMSIDGEWLVLNGGIGLDSTLYRKVGDGYVEVDLRLDGVQSGSLGDAPGLITWSRTDNSTRFWSFDNEPIRSEVLHSGRSVFMWAFTADGRFYASGASSDTSEDGAVVQVFDLHTLQPASPILRELVVDEAVTRTSVISLSFSPDGSRLVGVNSEGKAVIWDTGTWEVETVLAQGGDLVMLAEYTRDGRYLVTTAANGTTLLLDPVTLAQVGDSLIGQTSGSEGLSAGPAVTPDGRYIVTAADGTGRLWDLETRTQVGTGFPSSPNTAAATSRDGRWMTTFSDGMAIIWDLDITRWRDVACRAAGRNLTLDEWEQFAPAGETYHATCEMWPEAPGIGS